MWFFSYRIGWTYQMKFSKKHNYLNLNSYFRKIFLNSILKAAVLWKLILLLNGTFYFATEVISLASSTCDYFLFVLHLSTVITTCKSVRQWLAKVCFTAEIQRNTVLSHAFWPPVSRIWHTLAVLFCWWMAEIGSCIFCLAQYSANQAKKHSQGMPNAWDRWPEASDSTVPWEKL